MPSGKILGIFWDDNAFSVVESQNDVPQKVFNVPHQPAPEQDILTATSNADDICLINPLKAALQANNIKATEVNLVLPSKDIIIRSFLIPFLKPSEIKNVVEFEIKKYIPFNIKDIAFNFHVVTFTDDKIKRMRVHFVAIRKEILDRYKNILKLAGLNVVYSEPAAMCIARVLLFKKIIKMDQRVGVVRPDFNDHPGIMVIDKGVVQFVRDFQLQNPTLNLAPLDVETIKKKLFNEIKISSDFYMRQFKSEKLEEWVNLSFDLDQDLTSELHKELEIPTKRVNIAQIAKFPVSVDWGILAAHGINLRMIAKTVDFNLSGVASSQQTPSLKESVPQEYIPVIKVAVICAAVLSVVLVLTKMNTVQYRKKYDSIADSMGPFVDMQPDEIQKRIDDNREKLKEYQRNYEPTQMAFILTYVAKVLPPGMWLTDVSIRFTKDKEGAVTSGPFSPVAGSQSPSSRARFLNLDITGYVYNMDSNQQFKMVYAFVNQLKSDETLKKFAENISLVNIQSEEHGDEVVTNFKIRIK